MSKEILDSELNKEMNDLVEDEKLKIASEERLQKALWGFEVLEQEKVINSETTVTDLMNAVRTRRTELRETITYAKEMAKSKAVDEADAKLHDIAILEAEKSEKLWNYINATIIELDVLMLNGFADATAGRIKEKLKEKLQEMENSDIVVEHRKKKAWEKQL